MGRAAAGLGREDGEMELEILERRNFVIGFLFFHAIDMPLLSYFWKLESLSAAQGLCWGQVLLQ